MKLSRSLTFFILAYFILLITNVYAYNARFVPEFKENTLYLRIDLEEGCKTYWKHPGDSGMATSINLSNSENLKTYDILWPEPIEETVDGLTTYVYRNKVSIPVILHATNDESPITLKGEITYAICKDQCVPVIQEIFIPNVHVKESSSVYFILFAAIIGGFILNFMPCVFPVLLLKIFSILSGTHDYRKQLLFTISGIFFTFFSLAILTFFLKNVGLKFGLGSSFQQPQFIIMLCGIMVIFTSNLLGRFEIGLPGFISDLSSTKFTNLYINSFFTGIIAVIFATPCTAPFLGTAIAFSMSAELPMIVAIFLHIALGFSLPYIILMSAPEILKILPKPGIWMIVFKKILAIFMLGTIFWLLSILYTQLGGRALIEVTLLLLLVKFITELRIRFIPKLLILFLLFAALLYLPRISSTEDQSQEKLIEELWKPFAPHLIEEYLNQGKIVVVDFTADWCITCKYNKFMMWDRDRTIKLLSNPKIIALRADVTNYTRETQEFMSSMGIYGIPFDVVYSPISKSGVVLPTIVSYSELEKALKDAGL